jgi:hypothetical protein
MQVTAVFPAPLCIPPTINPLAVFVILSFLSQKIVLVLVIVLVIVFPSPFTSQH